MKEKKRSISIRTIVIILIVLIIILVNIFVYRFAMDVIVLFLLLLAVIFKEQKNFIKEWSIPIILFYLYEFLRGKAYVIAEWLHRPIYNEILVATEKKLFSIGGEVPTVFLQYSMSNIIKFFFSRKH